MTYLSFILSLFQFLKLDTSGYSMHRGLDIYLDMVVSWELLFLKLSLVGFVLALAIFAIGLMVIRDVPTGCWLYVLLLGVIWPILEGITYLMAKGLAGSVTAEAIVEPTKFWLLVIFMVLLGTG